MIECKLVPSKTQTAFGGLCALGHYLTEEKVAELRAAVESIQARHCRLPSHNYEREMLVVEMDLTGLRASKNAEYSTKGYFPDERNAARRQLVRASTPNCWEVIFEKLYPGNTNSCEFL